MPSETSKLTRIFRRWRETLALIFAAVGVIANIENIISLAQVVLAWLSHFRLP